MDWTALVSVVVSGSVGIAAVWSGRKTARETREAMERMTREQHAREDRLTHESRHVAWRENLYVDLYTILGRVHSWSNPETDNQLEPPDLEELYDLVMRAQVFASDRVGNLAMHWLGLWNDARREGDDEALKKILSQMTQTLRELREAIRDELVQPT